MISYENKAKAIGERIKKEREKINLGKKEFLERIYLSGASYKTLTAWEEGERLPDLTSLVRMAELFDCDVGFLLCDYDTHKRDTADIQELTGLSEDSIELLKRKWARIQKDNANGLHDTPNELELKAINTLLASPHSLFYHIYQYLFGDYDTFQMFTTDEQGNDKDVFDDDVLLGYKGKPDKGTFLNINKMQSVFMLEIQKGLTELRNLIGNTARRKQARKKRK